MKNSSIYQWKFWLVWLVWLVFFTYLGLQISCNSENSFDRNAEVKIQILLPGNGGLKNASATAGVKSVILTVTTGDEVLVMEELTISGNTASGTISILPGKNRKFTAEAMDENNIIQWHGSTTIDIVDNFTVGIELTSIAPSSTNLQALQQEKSINLSWTQNTDPDFARYDLYRSQDEIELGAVIYSNTVITETEFKDSLISGGNTYFYTLVVTDSEGFNSKSNVVRVVVSNSPPSASILQVISISNSMVELSWTQNTEPDFARYDLYRSLSESELGTIIHSTTVKTEIGFKDNLVSQGKTYFYTLVVTDSEGFNSKSNVVQADIPNIPPSASILQVISTSSNMVELSWTQNSNANFSGYDLYRSQTENELGTIIHSTSIITEIGFKDNSVSGGNTYFYTLVVVDSEGFNAKSNVVRADIPKIPPSASILKVISTSSNMVELSWTQNTNPNFLGYDLYRSQAENELGTIIHSTTIITEIGFKDNSVSGGNSYFYTLVVAYSEGINTKSNVVRVDIPNIPPSASILKVISISNSMVELSWTQNTNQNFSGYDLYRSQAENELGTIIHSTTINTEIGFKDNSVSQGNAYFYTLVVTNSEGLNTKSNVVQADIPNIPPSASILQVISASSNMVELSWTQNTDKDFVRYDLYRSQSVNVLGTIINSSTVITEIGFKDNLVSQGNSYFYTLVVLDTEGFNKKSNVVRADIPFIPPTASVLQVISIGASKVGLSWTQNTDQDFSRYDLYRSQSENSLGTVIHSTTAFNNTEFEDNTVSPNNSYFYTLVVFDADESNSKSNVVRVDMPNIPPTASILQVISTNSKMVKLSWTQNTDLDFARYELYRSQSENVIGTIIHSATGITNTGFEDNTVSPNTTYLYTLVVFDTEELSAKSNVVRVEVPHVPPTASILKLNSASSSVVNLSWTQNTDPDFERYDLYRSQSENVLGSIIYSTNVVTIMGFLDGRISEGNIYYYTLVVTNTKGLNSTSNVVEIDIPSTPPTASVLSSEEEGAYLYWTQNTDSDFSKYVLYRSTNENELGIDLFSTFDKDSIWFYDDSVSEGNSYYYTLIVHDVEGLSTASNVVNIDLPNYDPYPGYLYVDSVFYYKVNLSWDQNYDNDFERYDLYREEFDANDEDYIDGHTIFSTTDIANTKFEDTTVTPYTSYRYKLIVFDIGGLSAESNKIEVYTSD